MDKKNQINRRVLSFGIAASALPLTQAARARDLPPSGGQFMPAESEAANIAIVRDFIAAFTQEDLGTISALLADECSFRTSQQRPPVVGKDKVVGLIKGLFDLWDFELKIVQAIALGPVVLTRREDTIRAKDGQKSELKIAAGMFFLDNGRIVEWTDYILR